MNLSNISSEDLLALADNLTRLKNLKESVKEYEAYYMQVNEDFARVLNEIADLERTLKDMGFIII